MVSLRREDWAALECAFLRGAASPAVPAPGRAQHIFEAAVDGCVRHLPAALRLRLKAIDCRRRLALDAARQGDLHSAAALLDEAALLGAPSALRPPATAIAESFLHAVAAYVSYRRGDWGAAGDHLRQALERDEELIEQGWSIFEMHRVQIGHNWMRVRARRGDDSQAADLGVGLLAYLRSRGRNDRWPSALPHRRSDAPVEWGAIPGELVDAMEDQIACELAVSLARLPIDRHARHVAAVAGDMPVRATRARRFLHLVWARSCGRRAAFMRGAPGFLEDGGRRPFLWEAFVYELLRDRDHPNPDAWRRALAARPAPWTFLPLASREEPA